jgi:hypothetical protein
MVDRQPPKRAEDEQVVLPVLGADEPAIDWRSRVSTVGLVVGSAMVGLERVLFPEKRKADTEQVTNEPLDRWPNLDFGNAKLDPLGPDEDGYWPTY